MRTHLYRPLLRPPSCCSLPAGVHWDYVHAPTLGGLIDWFGLPQSRHPFGVIGTDRELTVEECKRFDLAPLVCDPSTGSPWVTNPMLAASSCSSAAVAELSTQPI